MNVDLYSYRMTETLGFVLEEPLEYLPMYFEPWNYLAKNVMGILARGNMRSSLDQIPLLDVTKLENDHKSIRLAHLQMSTLISAYVWCEGDANVPKVLPENLSIPFWKLCRLLGTQPSVAPHLSLALANYKIKDSNRILCVENMEMLYFKFMEDYGNDWFFLLTTQLELDFAKGLPQLMAAIEAAKMENLAQLENSLVALSRTIAIMDNSLRRMSEHLCSETFFFGFRPYMAGTSNGLYEKWGGIILQGVDEVPRKLTGGSAAQSSSLQCLDSCLNIIHEDSRARYLFDVRNYILPEHKKFIEFVESSSNIRSVISMNPYESLVEAYNACVKNLVLFRSHHIQTVSKFIVSPRAKEHEIVGACCAYKSLNEVGTGGTGIMPFLKSVRDSTAEHLLS